MQNVSRQVLADFVANLASREPSPGCGAAAAVALSLAAGCAAKAFAISHLHRAAPELNAAAERAVGIATIALELAQRDGDDFRAWLKTHSAAAAERLGEDSSVLSSLSEELERLVQDHAPQVIDSLLLDLAASRDLFKVAVAIENRNGSQFRS